MDVEQQRTLAVWLIFVVPFVFLFGFLLLYDSLTLEIVAIYWFPAIILTMIGVIDPPWTLVSDAE